LHFGTPTQQEKDAYTRVLLGNLDIEKLRYPAKSSIHGGDIDVLARRWLWAAGLDYGHGTGHGVGYFLNVHEGPNGISKYRTEPLVPGMIVSNGTHLDAFKNLGTTPTASSASVSRI
jgi:Xaa-Pro aminopeptidase